MKIDLESKLQNINNGDVIISSKRLLVINTCNFDYGGEFVVFNLDLNRMECFEDQEHLEENYKISQVIPSDEIEIIRI